VYGTNPIATATRDQQETREVTQLLSYAAREQLQGGDLKSALECCRGALNAGRSLGDEPFFISQLIRMACVAIACADVERVLANGEAPAEELKKAQDLLAREDRDTSFRQALRGERAVSNAVYERIRSGAIPMQEFEATQPKKSLWD